jgi:hypothetical protein
VGTDSKSTLLKIWRFLAALTRRAILRFGFLTRTTILLYFGLGVVIAAKPSPRVWYWSVATMLIQVTTIIVVVFLICGGSKHFGRWAIFGAVIVLLAATGPCWFTFPGQDFPSPSVQERGTIRVLRSVQEQEERYRARFHRYGDLLEIHEETITTTDGSRGVLPLFWYGSYGVHLVAGDTAYQLTADPPAERGYGCWIGCPGYRHFYADQSGVLRANRHCAAATAHSGAVR